MRVRNGGALVWLALLASGCGGLAMESHAVTAQACPPGVASRTRVVNPPGASVNTHLEGLTDVQGMLYFTLAAPGGGTGLWRSDGTEAGTVQVRSFPAGVFAEGTPAAVGNTLFFQLADSATGMVHLWTSDGTSAGTRFIKAFTPDVNGPALRAVTALHGRLVFFHLGASGGPALWSSDGTSAGTVLLANLPGVLGLYFDQTLRVGDALLFFRSQGGATTLWRTDGTQAGTMSLKQLDAGTVSIQQVGRAGDQGLFVLRDGPNDEVWKTNGTAAGTLRLDTFGQRVRLVGGLGSKVYVAQSARLYSLSLGGGGRTLVTTLPRDNPDQLPAVLRTAASGDSLYFSVGLNGLSPVPDDVRLWVTNGTATGTRELFRSLHRNDTSYSPVFATGTGAVLFTGSPDGTANRPWFTRGTTATTGQLAKVTVPVVLGLGPEPFVRAGGRVFFPATDDTGLEQLWSVPASFSCPPGVAAESL
nr:lipoprotein [Myxococcus sp. MH1]